jgi:hypothetical protein
MTSPSLLLDDLPPPLGAIRARPLFVMHLDVAPLQVVGETPGVRRRVGVIQGGRFKGERLSGEVLNGGSDWQSVRTDGGVLLDVRLVLRTEDGAMIGMTYQGVRHGPPDVIARVEKGEAVDPALYYFRIAPVFETAAAQYTWLNDILAVGAGYRRADGPIYSVFEVL